LDVARRGWSTLGGRGLAARRHWWQVLLFTLVVTHITIAAVTIFLHRAQAHRALDLHPCRRTSSASGCG
jgi:fatty-acid desaturase